MFVPAFQVFCFTFIKRPIISALWYAVLVHLIMEPFSTAAILISSAILAISCFAVRFYLAIASPIPMIASLVLCYLNYPHLFVYFLVFSVIWSIICVVALVVTLKNAKGIYYIDPVTGIMYKR